MTTTLHRIDPANQSGITRIQPGVHFDRDMVWIDEYLWRPTIVTVTPTVGDGVNVQRYSKSEKGRPITLQSLDHQGRQTKAIVDLLKAEEAEEDAKWYLEISKNGKSLAKVVIFAPPDDKGAVQFTMRHNCNGLQADDFWYNGALYLMVDVWP